MGLGIGAFLAFFCQSKELYLFIDHIIRRISNLISKNEKIPLDKIYLFLKYI